MHAQLTEPACVAMSMEEQQAEECLALAANALRLRRSHGCDSSDCLQCQYARACSTCDTDPVAVATALGKSGGQAVPSQVVTCSQAGRHRLGVKRQPSVSGSFTDDDDDDEGEGFSGRSAAEEEDDDDGRGGFAHVRDALNQARPSQDASRSRERSYADRDRCGLAAAAAAPPRRRGVDACGPEPWEPDARLLPSPWRYHPRFTALPRETPAPARLVELERLSPSVGCKPLSPSMPAGRTTDIISEMDFHSGLGVLAVGMATKQIRLYDVSNPGLERRYSGSWARSRGSGSGSGKRHSPARPRVRQRLLLTHDMPAKVGCVAWAPEQSSNDGLLTVGDYDGVLHQLSPASGHHIAEVEAHGGRRVRSVKHSHLSPNMVISASDDGTARLWAGKGLTTEAAVLRPPPAPGTPAGGRTPLLSAEFSPEAEHLVAVASANRCVYLFDTRRADVPLQAMRGHDAPVTYLAFLAGQRLVSAGADAAVAVWDVAGTASRSDGSAGGAHEPLIVMRGHQNEKNFVGLSVRPHDGLIACGSETGDVFVYYPEWSLPIATARVVGNAQSGDSRTEFVSAVCWLDTPGGDGPPMLAAGTSCGMVSLLALAEA